MSVAVSITGQYLDIDHPASCDGLLTGIQICSHYMPPSNVRHDIYLRFAPPSNARHDLVLRIWRLNNESRVLTKEIRIPNETLSEFTSCTNWSTNPYDHINLKQGDVFGIFIPTYSSSPIISNGSDESVLYQDARNESNFELSLQESDLIPKRNVMLNIHALISPTHSTTLQSTPAVHVSSSFEKMSLSTVYQEPIITSDIDQSFSTSRTKTKFNFITSSNNGIQPSLTKQPSYYITGTYSVVGSSMNLAPSPTSPSVLSSLRPDVVIEASQSLLSKQTKANPNDAISEYIQNALLKSTKNYAAEISPSLSESKLLLPTSVETTRQSGITIDTDNRETTTIRGITTSIHMYSLTQPKMSISRRKILTKSISIQKTIQSSLALTVSVRNDVATSLFKIPLASTVFDIPFETTLLSLLPTSVTNSFALSQSPDLSKPMSSSLDTYIPTSGLLLTSTDKNYPATTIDPSLTSTQKETYSYTSHIFAVSRESSMTHSQILVDIKYSTVSCPSTTESVVYPTFKIPPSSVLLELISVLSSIGPTPSPSEVVLTSFRSMKPSHTPPEPKHTLLLSELPNLTVQSVSVKPTPTSQSGTFQPTLEPSESKQTPLLSAPLKTSLASQLTSIRSPTVLLTSSPSTPPSTNLTPTMISDSPGDPIPKTDSSVSLIAVIIVVCISFTILSGGVMLMVIYIMHYRKMPKVDPQINSKRRTILGIGKKRRGQRLKLYSHVGNSPNSS